MKLYLRLLVITAIVCLVFISYYISIGDSQATITLVLVFMLLLNVISHIRKRLK